MIAVRPSETRTAKRVDGSPGRWPGLFLCTGLIVASATLMSSVAAAADDRRTATAIEATTAITLDGALDEEVWRAAEPASDFIQAEPYEGDPASESTEVRIVFDRDALYLGVRCHDSTAGGIIVNDIRKDFAPGEQDSFEVILDTFADRRNGFVFAINAAGAKSDTQIANEGRDVNTSWDAVWTVATSATSDGWSAEIRIPFKTLRFERGEGRIWGVNFSRRIRRKNEIDYWSPVPRVYNLYRAGFGGTLEGLPDAAQGSNLRVKPWVSANSTRPLGGTFDDGARMGLDAKYGVTPSLTLDVTVRPDFAQAEADEQQVNLTQFSLFFPEKREFFLENSGMFYFGDIPRESRLGTQRFSPPEEEMLLFFSRRIGLTDQGEEIPIEAGGRLTGRAGGFGVGAMTIQTGEHGGRAGDNYTVLRARHDILGNSDLGAIFLSRQSMDLSTDRNSVAGVDANFRFVRALSINGFLTRSSTPGVQSGEAAGKGSITWNDNRLHAQYSLLSVGDNFRDDIGFIKRTGVRKHFVDFGIRQRPEWIRRFGIRELHPHTRYNIYTDQSNTKVSHTNHVAYAWFFESGGYLELQWNPRFERIVTPFKVRPDQSFTPGSYGWNEYAIELETNHSRKLSGSALITLGGFWTGTQKSTKVGVVFRPSYHLSFDTALQRNDISLPFPMHDFVTNLVTSRVGYAFNTRTFLDTLLQYNTDLKQFSANVRFDLIHRPLSDLFVVYNEQQQTNRDLTSGRGLILKYTHMLAF
jgi:hypothetical protein